VSIAYNSYEELKIGEKISDNPCRCCGSVFGTNYYEIGVELREKGLCFTCNFWTTVVEEVNKSDKHVIVDGIKYTVGPQKIPKYGFRGHGGALFIIKLLNSDRIIKTTNLWCQGEIPERFR